MRTALFPGSFDPFTLGHLDVLERALRLFDRVEVTVAVNANKKTLFTADERCELIRASTAHLDGVLVRVFEGLIAEEACRRGAVALVRGLRGVGDLLYEQPMAAANRRLCPGLETIFILPAEAYAQISSTIVRDIHRWGGDAAGFVPAAVVEALRSKA